jgi:succinate dehydrogenase flavin-adding protein (antitoxin of CptAB toxin-antitoxin module)
MFEKLTDAELRELQIVMAQGENDLWEADWLRHGNQKAAYRNMIHEITLVATELAGVVASRKWS